MCKPNKALRMTVKIHIKTEEKKRAAAAAAVVAEIETPAVTVKPSATSAALSEPPAGDVPANTDETRELPVTDASTAAGATDPMAQVEEVCLLRHKHCAQRHSLLAGATRANFSRSQTTKFNKVRP